nr:hypothetical protein [Providencia rettgeri]
MTSSVKRTGWTMALGTGWTLIPSTAGLSLELALTDAPAVAVWLPFLDATTTGSSDAESPERWSTTPLSTDSVLLLTSRPFAMAGPAVIDAIKSANILTCLLFNICSPEQWQTQYTGSYRDSFVNAVHFVYLAFTPS